MNIYTVEWYDGYEESGICLVTTDRNQALSVCKELKGEDKSNLIFSVFKYRNGTGVSIKVMELYK